jgi:hypothetical protein
MCPVRDFAKKELVANMYPIKVANRDNWTVKGLSNFLQGSVKLHGWAWYFKVKVIGSDLASICTLSRQKPQTVHAPQKGNFSEKKQQAAKKILTATLKSSIFVLLCRSGGIGRRARFRV